MFNEEGALPTIEENVCVLTKCSQLNNSSWFSFTMYLHTIYVIMRKTVICYNTFFSFAKSSIYLNISYAAIM